MLLNKIVFAVYFYYLDVFRPATLQYIISEEIVEPR